MNNYLAKVTYERQTGDEGLKLVSEQYLVRGAQSFTEAEERAIEHVKPYAFTETTPIVIDSIRKLKLASIERKSERSELDQFWRAKIAHASLDEKMGKEKVRKYSILIEAENIWDANKGLQAYTDECVTSDLSPISLELLDIVDIIETGTNGDKPNENLSVTISFSDLEAITQSGN